MNTPLGLGAVVGPFGVTWTRMGVPRWSRASLIGFAIAVSAVLLLLLALGEVARHAVDLGEQRRRATALHWQATWKCQALRGKAASRDCLERLRAAPPATAAQPAFTTISSTPPDRVADPKDR
jgi:hypothetical protein